MSMKYKNVYASDLEEYLKAVNKLNIRNKTIKKLAKSLKLSREVLGVSCEPDVQDALRVLGEFDTVRLEMLERIENNYTLLSRPEISKEIKKAGFIGPMDFIASAKAELAGEKDKGALKRVLKRGEARREEAKKNGDYLVPQDPDAFHPMGRIDESEIGQSINAATVKQLVISFRK